jgi:hypothetical protein
MLNDFLLAFTTKFLLRSREERKRVDYMNKNNSRLLAVASILACLPGTSFGQVLLGNYPPSNDNSASTINGLATPAWKGVSFSLAAGQQYDVTSVDLRLFNFTSVDTPVVGIYPDSSGVPSTTALFTFNNAAPNALASDISTSTFTAPGGATVGDASLPTTYWLVLKGADTATSYGWVASNSDTPNSTVPTGIASFGSFRTASGGVWSGTASSTHNTFQINATAVPEPAHFAAAGAGALLIFGIIRRLSLKRTGE